MVSNWVNVSEKEDALKSILGQQDTTSASDHRSNKSSLCLIAQLKILSTSVVVGQESPPNRAVRNATPLDVAWRPWSHSTAIFEVNEQKSLTTRATHNVTHEPVFPKPSTVSKSVWRLSSNRDFKLTCIHIISRFAVDVISREVRTSLRINFEVVWVLVWENLKENHLLMRNRQRRWHKRFALWKII